MSMGLRTSLGLCLAALAGCAAPPPEPPPEPAEFTFEFKRATGDLHTVTVSVGKVDPDAGLVRWEGPHQAGDKIGWGLENGVLTSRHWARSVDLDRDVEVDFDSGATLVEIRAAVTVTYDWSYCDLIREPLDTTPCSGVRKRKGTYVADEFVYRDRHGEHQVVGIPGLPPFRDALCTLHGGDREIRHVKSPEERQTWIDNRAADLKAVADDQWRSRNPAIRRKAQEGYRELLQKYACAKCVVEHQTTLFNRMNENVED